MGFAISNNSAFLYLEIFEMPYDFSRYYVHTDDLSLMVFGNYEENRQFRTPIGFISLSSQEVTNHQELPGDVINEPDMMKNVIVFEKLEEAIKYIEESPKSKPAYWTMPEKSL
ncbi:hypothetical protein FD723_40135 (plasmid) [Nostoc sp. C052]|uniref:hypothetical protein n=1 Tax=Nostoc sp. C052 TaxID=2576902 RepID=UPI0015C32964|nr:hypothetical protein [Nostoc sp. C052]QLE46423.1 hypothetical protein FD723_40135 [Nostoc sp. C052]